MRAITAGLVIAVRKSLSHRRTARVSRWHRKTRGVLSSRPPSRLWIFTNRRWIWGEVAYATARVDPPEVDVQIWKVNKPQITRRPWPFFERKRLTAGLGIAFFCDSRVVKLADSSTIPISTIKKNEDLYCIVFNFSVKVNCNPDRHSHWSKTPKNTPNSSSSVV